MRNVDEYARRILERTENLPGEDLMKMHGVMRDVRHYGEDFFNPDTKRKTVNVAGVDLSRPRRPGPHPPQRPRGRHGYRASRAASPPSRRSRRTRRDRSTLHWSWTTIPARTLACSVSPGIVFFTGRMKSSPWRRRNHENSRRGHRQYFSWATMHSAWKLPTA